MNKSFTFIAIGLVVLCGCESKQSRMQQLLLKGNIASKDRNWQQALRYYEQATQMNDCFADAWNNAGTVYFEQKRYEQALASYDKALTCDPHFLNALINRANTTYQLKEYYRSIDDLQKVIVARPDTAIAYFALGLSYTRLRDFAKALQVFSKAKQIAGNDAKMKQELLVNHAIVYYYLHHYDSAQTELQQAARLNDREPNIYNTLSLIEVELKHYTEALNLVNEAIRLDPHQSYYVNNRGYIYLLQNELSKAEVDIDESISKDPDNAWAYRNKGIYYLMKEDYPSAERLLKQALKMDSFVDKIHFYMGMAYLKNGKKELACQSFAKSKQAEDLLLTPDLLRNCK
ncbi:MAG: tetratricopeptide repeat protein [Bacteroidetes bacterium]|nr:tetratricopeptide repeat protein [Bacteroidota bacterium]MBS1539711.1 tetratricopeptide repeat protein [Bacteroidota bacterium]